MEGYRLEQKDWPKGMSALMEDITEQLVFFTDWVNVQITITGLPNNIQATLDVQEAWWVGELLKGHLEKTEGYVTIMSGVAGRVTLMFVILKQSIEVDIDKWKLLPCKPCILWGKEKRKMQTKVDEGEIELKIYGTRIEFRDLYEELHTWTPGGWMV